jgi:hypothetical protein
MKKRSGKILVGDQTKKAMKKKIENFLFANKKSGKKKSRKIFVCEQKNKVIRKKKKGYLICQSNEQSVVSNSSHLRPFAFLRSGTQVKKKF